MTERLSLQLPLSITMVTRVLEVLDAAWPGSVVVTRGTPADHMVVELGSAPRRRGRRPGPFQPAEQDVEVFLTSLRDGTFGLTPPEWFTKVMASISGGMLDDAGAENYLEMRVGSDDVAEYVITVRRAAGRTPHQLHEDALAVVADTAATLAEVATMWQRGDRPFRDDVGAWRVTPGGLSDAASVVLSDEIAAVLDAIDADDAAVEADEAD